MKPAPCSFETVRPEVAPARGGARANGEAGPKGERQEGASDGELGAPSAHASIPRHERISSAPLHSAIYAGWVRHRRHAPHAHAFRYRMYMLYLDLAELDGVFAGRWLWSVNRPNLSEFRRSDYLGDPGVPLDAAVRARILEVCGRAPNGPIRLLTHLRTCGHCFNPVSFYYCYDDDGVTLDTIVAEITNTPWKERHSYVLPVAGAERNGAALRWDFRKCFHVSPFMPMQRDYAWRFTAPDAALRVHMDVLDGVARDFDATLMLQRRPLNGANLARALLRFPAVTLRIIAAIHWQALRLWLRRNPIYNHQKSPENGKT